MEINYERCNVSKRLKTEIIHARGESFWNELSQDILVPADDMEAKQCSQCMRSFMEKFEQMAPQEEIKAIMVNVRHDLSKDDFEWAVRLFNEMNTIDRFASELQRKWIDEMTAGFGSQPGQPEQAIENEIIDYVNSVEDIFYGKRHGNEILAQAIPADLKNFLHPVDPLHKRYHACHCQFGRESILEGAQVSALLCDCSLGHTLVLWETVLGRKLEGEVVESVLMGSDRCVFRIKLPEDIVAQWT
jgi:hypothetical protein